MAPFVVDAAGLGHDHTGGTGVEAGEPEKKGPGMRWRRQQVPV